MARRNNANRLGGPGGDTSTPAHNDEELQTDGLSFIVPTEFVALPSRGQFYPPNHPLHNEETIEIKYMTAKEEDLLSSKSLIERGVVLDRLIQNLVVDRRLKARDLLISDRNAILIAARSSGYGIDYSTKITCRNCSTQDTYEYNLEEAVTQPPLTKKELKSLGVTPTENATFMVTVPSTPVEVEFQLLTGHDEHAMVDLAERRRKRKMPDQLVTDQLGFMIVSAMGETDVAVLQRYVDSLPLRDSRFLRKTYEAVSPSIELRKEFVCNHCDCEDEVNFPFTVDFFWPDI